MELYACPVRLFFTPEVEGWLALFQQTHEIRLTQAGPRWERTADIRRRHAALTVEVLDFIKRQWNHLLYTEQSAGRRGQSHG